MKSNQTGLIKLTKSHDQTKRAMLNVMEDLESAKALIELEKVKDDAVLASIGEGLISVDNNSVVTMVNTAAAEMLSLDKKAIVGQPVTGLRLEDESGQAVPLNERPTHMALTTGNLINSTYFIVKKDKTRFPIAINVTPIKLNDKIIGAIIIFRDVTREREIDKAKSEFVSLASHQLRTPLGISKWYLEAIKTEGYLDKVSDKAKDYFNEVYKSNERLLILVRDLLSISRIDQGKVKNTPQKINMVDLIQDVVKNMTVLAKNNKIEISLDLKKTDTTTIFIDPLRVREVIENLVTNAITYSTSPGKVEIVVDTSDDEICIAVKDTGIGISTEDKKKLFTKFFRSEKAVVKNTEGSGLGLYVVKSYVEGWGGNISVESSEKDGSTFSITLPLKIINTDAVSH